MQLADSLWSKGEYDYFIGGSTVQLLTLQHTDKLLAQLKLFSHSPKVGRHGKIPVSWMASLLNEHDNTPGDFNSSRCPVNITCSESPFHSTLSSNMASKVKTKPVMIDTLLQTIMPMVSHTRCNGWNLISHCCIVLLIYGSPATPGL